jgi:hypothetical protein
MVDAAAAGQSIGVPGGRNADARRRRRAVRFTRGLCLALGGLLTACALVATVVVASAWLVRSTLSANPYLRAKAKYAVASAQPAERYAAIDANRFAGSPRMPDIALESAAALGALVFDASGTHTTASDFRRRSVIAPQLPIASPLRPVVPHGDAQRDLAYAPDTARIAALIPIAAPASVPSLPPPELAPVRVMTPPPFPPARPATQNSAASAPQVEVASLTTGSIPGSGTLPERETTAVPKWHAGNRVAVYDIAGQMVYLPNGERLEAHSGLGHKRDDPRYTRIKMQGPTPPNVYDLTMRERLFHGVRAIRLNPVDEAKMYGRDGMLAHTYLLGPSGQSNGCISFKDYSRFLRAFQRGEIDRIVVVSRLGSESWRTVAARARLARRYADSKR